MVHERTKKVKKIDIRKQSELCSNRIDTTNSEQPYLIAVQGATKEKRRKKGENSTGEKKEDEKSIKNSLDRAWISLSGTWYDRNCTSYPANCSVLHGNAVLLCQEFKETA